MNLVISSNNKLWNKDKNYLVGSWCYDHDKFFEKRSDSNFIHYYHWSDKTKLKKDLEYLFSVIKFFINKLKKILNIFYQRDYSKRYYEITLSKWLWRFVLFHFDRWEMIRTIDLNKYNFEAKVICFKEEFFIPNNTYDYCTSIIYSEDWNHWVISKIIEKFKKIKICNINLNKIEPRIKHNKQKSENIKKFLNFFLSKISSKKIFAQNMSLSKPANIIFNFYYKQFRIPYDEKSNIINGNKTDIFLRKKIFKEKTEDNFINFLFDQLIYNFPKIFLENYQDNKIRFKNLFYPKSPSTIMTSLDHHFNDLFNLYAAENIENKSKYFVFQHGGSYGITDNFIAERLDVLVSDKFFTWGWKNHKKNVSFFAQKYFFKKEINEFTKRTGIVLPTTEFKKFPGDIAGGRPRYKDEIDMHIQDIASFIKNLTKKNQSKTHLKYLITRDTNYVKKSISNLFPNLKLIESKKNTYKMNYRISVETLNSTGFLDAMHLNHPVILLLNENFSNIRPSVSSDFIMLKKLNIVHFNPLTAAKFINNCYDNLEKWWLDKNLQNFRKKFCKKFAKKSNKPLSDIRKII